MLAREGCRLINLGQQWEGRGGKRRKEGNGVRDVGFDPEQVLQIPERILCREKLLHKTPAERKNKTVFF